MFVSKYWLWCYAGVRLLQDSDKASIADDLTLAVAQLSLENEKRGPAVSYTPTPNNTPFGRLFLVLIG